MTDTPENNPISNDKIDPNHSKPLDVHTWSEHTEIKKLVDDLWFQVVEPTLGGKSNNQGRSDPKRHLKVLLLDLYVAWLDDPTLCIGINRSNNAYQVNSRYNAMIYWERLWMWSVCMPVTLSWMLMHDTCYCDPVYSDIVIVASVDPCMGHRGCAG